MTGIIISRTNSSTRDVQWSSTSETASQTIYDFTPELESQAYFWTAEWQQGEKEADREIRSGKTRRFSSVEQAITWLRR